MNPETSKRMNKGTKPNPSEAFRLWGFGLIQRTCTARVWDLGRSRKLPASRPSTKNLVAKCTDPENMHAYPLLAELLWFALVDTQGAAEDKWGA